MATKGSMEVSTVLLVLLLVSSYLFAALVVGEALEVEDQTEFNYIEGSPKGPSNWGNIKPEWATCKNGKMQSPIELINRGLDLEVQVLTSGVEVFYEPGNATLRNRGHDIQVELNDQNRNKIRINGIDYILQQFHYHSPSEHTILGRKFDLELHLVHVSADPNAQFQIAVVGVLYNIGNPDDFLSTLTDRIRPMFNKEPSDEVRAGIIDLSKIRIGGINKYYRYMGSLTTPPCIEGVIWTVNARIKTVSREQINMLREAVNDGSAQNARPVQPLNGRTVRLYTTISIGT